MILLLQLKGNSKNQTNYYYIKGQILTLIIINMKSIINFRIIKFIYTFQHFFRKFTKF